MEGYLATSLSNRWPWAEKEAAHFCASTQHKALLEADESGTLLHFNMAQNSDLKHILRAVNVQHKPSFTTQSKYLFLQTSKRR